MRASLRPHCALPDHPPAEFPGGATDPAMRGTWVSASSGHWKACTTDVNIADTSVVWEFTHDMYYKYEWNGDSLDHCYYDDIAPYSVRGSGLFGDDLSESDSTGCDVWWLSSYVRFEGEELVVQRVSRDSSVCPGYIVTGEYVETSRFRRFDGLAPPSEWSAKPCGWLAAGVDGGHAGVGPD